jgi:hypothetical protein
MNYKITTSCEIMSFKIGNFNIGRWLKGSTPSRYLDAYIHEIIIFRKKLDDSERKDIEKYLSKKWSIKIN